MTHIPLQTLKGYTIGLLEKRGVSIDQLIEGLKQTLQEDRRELIHQGYSPEIRDEDAKHFLSATFENEELLQAVIMGIELDVLAEKGLLKEPLLSIIREDHPLMSADEMLVLSAVSKTADNEFSHQDIHKANVVKELDEANNQVNTFLDDIAGALIAQAYAIYKEYQKAQKEIQDQHGIRPPVKPPYPDQYPMDRLNESEQDLSFFDDRPSEDVKRVLKRNWEPKEIKKEALKQMEERGVDVQQLVNASYRMQSKYNPDLQQKDVRGVLNKVMEENRELSTFCLIAAEMDRLLMSGQLSEMMKQLIFSRNFYPARKLAQAYSQRGGISSTNFGYMTKSRHEKQVFDSYLDNFGVFTREAIRSIVANTNHQLAHTYHANKVSRALRQAVKLPLGLGFLKRGNREAVR